MKLKEELDKLYLEYNHREFIHPDPLEFLYNYENIKDREIAGLIASALAYGRVTQILKSISFVLGKMTPSPFIFIKKSSFDLFYNHFKDFKHRFTTGVELCHLLIGIKNALEKYGSLNNCFLKGYNTDEKIQGRARGRTCQKSNSFVSKTKEFLKKAQEKACEEKQKKSHGMIPGENREVTTEGNEEETIMPAVLSFAKNLNAFAGVKCNSLIPSSAGGSAFKRLNLYLRWMVRKDNVDPGGWINISASKLIIPLDTHIYRISVKLGFTRRKQADIRTAIEITNALKEFDKNDPVKYDFALTRLGMSSIEEAVF